jgi:hypothetical protein
MVVANPEYLDTWTAQVTIPAGAHYFQVGVNAPEGRVLLAPGYREDPGGEGSSVDPSGLTPLVCRASYPNDGGEPGWCWHFDNPDTVDRTVTLQWITVDSLTVAPLAANVEASPTVDAVAVTAEPTMDGP